MLNMLSLSLAFLLLLIGAFFLYGLDSGPDTSQTVQLLGGAGLVSVGLVTILLVAKDWLHWRRLDKNDANGLELEPRKRNLTPK